MDKRTSRGESASPTISLHPLFWLAAAFAAGVVAGAQLPTDWRIAPAVSALGAASALVFIRKKSAPLFLLLAFFAAGTFCFQTGNQPVRDDRIRRIYDENRLKSGEPVEVEGVVRGETESAAGGFFLLLDAEKLTAGGVERKVSGTVRLFAELSSEPTADEFRNLELRGGARIRVACGLRREDAFLNPGVVSKKELLDGQGIDATAVVKSPANVEKLADPRGFSPVRLLSDWRKTLIDGFRSRFGVATAGIMIASLLGDKYFLDKPTAELFRDDGTFHVLVISGLHITFIGGLALLLVRVFTRRRFWQFVVAAGFLWAYSIAVGAEVPVVRAAIMFTGVLFSQVVYRRASLLNAVGLCSLLLLVWRPEDLFSQSFQLTLLSVLAIVAGAFPLVEKLRAIGEWQPSAETPFPPNVPVPLKRFCEMLYWREAAWRIESGRQIWSANLFKSPYLKILEARGGQGVVRYLFEGILVSLIVQAWLLPLGVLFFHRVSIASVLLNLWVGFFIALESFAAVIALALAAVSEQAALPLVKLTEALNWLLLAVPRVFVENDLAGFRVPAYTGPWRSIYVLYFAAVLILTIAVNRWRPFDLDHKSRKFRVRGAAAAFLLLAALVVFHPFSAPAPDGRLHIDFLDVGQGDAALVTFPNGETLLVDGGGRPNYGRQYVQRDGAEPELFEPDAATIGETVVSRFLWEKGYSRIDYLLATHADADHIQGLTDVAKNFRVRAAFFGRTPETDADFAALAEVLRRRRIEAVVVKRGDVLDFGAARVEVLYPEADDSATADADNDHSVVLRVLFGAKRFLLTGDIEKGTERLLLANPDFLRADVVKVAHHGSRTSSTADFVAATRAVYAIVSVGRTSQFGHPHREIVERWQAAGAKILTTGERGTISVSTGGNDLVLNRFLP
ncbi:MAG: ComEC/Rec2 family competence protein [Acidobacteria bacterium]|nr:ComEC/Rec2 family competence protein [Acidobacteriota bacterium]